MPKANRAQYKVSGTIQGVDYPSVLGEGAMCGEPKSSQGKSNVIRVRETKKD